ncbi:Ubiquitin-like domain superfamily [Sesbania bispinosa]|nr:Ubiquitin-like domain superfamily [Sesbania bispinosa]
MGKIGGDGGSTTDHHRHSSKRKFEDYSSSFDDEDNDNANSFDLVSVRTKKDAEATPFGASSRLQFFVRMMPKGNSVVMQCSGEETVKSVHERIERMTGIPVREQRLIYEGKQLRCEQSLRECGIQKDANLQLVGHLRSGEHPPSCSWHDDANLHRFLQLLSKTDKCLHTLENCFANKEPWEGDEDVANTCSMLLIILKDLHEISKHYDGAEDKFWSVLMHRRSLLSLLIVRFAKRTDDNQWVFEKKCVTDFECRRHLAMMLFPDVEEDFEDLHEMLIDRSQLLAESFEYIAEAEPESLHTGLFIKFKNEDASGPGVLREWFFLVCQALFNPLNALFEACPNDRRRFFPNPASKVHPLHLEYFSFCGRIIALALMNKVQVGIAFDRVFFMQLAGNCITLEDIQDADPYLYSSCKQILEMDANFIDSDALGLTFAREVEEFGYMKVIELCPGGKTLVVNSKNREKYVDLLIQNRFVTSISEQVSHFAKGFCDILSNSSLQQFFQNLELEDLDWMLHGSEKAISVKDWREHTEYIGYKETDRQISWFWEAGMALLGNRYLPLDALLLGECQQNKGRSAEPDDRLPSSHTCFYRLCIPPYSSKAVMQDRLGVITHEHIGCSFGTC